MSNYKDLSSEELKRTLAEKQDILRRTMKPDEYKKFMQELDDCQIKIDYSKFGKPVQYPETKKEKRQMMHYQKMVIVVNKSLLFVLLTVQKQKCVDLVQRLHFLRQQRISHMMVIIHVELLVILGLGEVFQLSKCRT